MVDADRKCSYFILLDINLASIEITNGTKIMTAFTKNFLSAASPREPSTAAEMQQHQLLNID